MYKDNELFGSKRVLTYLTAKDGVRTPPVYTYVMIVRKAPTLAPNLFWAYPYVKYLKNSVIFVISLLEQKLYFELL